MSDTLTPTEPMAVIEVDQNIGTLTLTEALRRVSLLNLGPNGVILRTASGAFVNTNPAAPVSAEGEAIVRINESFPLWTSLTSVRYKTAAAGSAFLQMAADTE